MIRLAVIPARGGSRRVPRKNVRLFEGRPLLTWPIEVAIASGVFREIVVSTDDAEIADIARAAGATVPFLRPEELADDFTPTVPVIAHAVAEMAHAGQNFDSVCCIYPGAVFVTANDLVKSAELASRHADRFTASVVRYPHPIQRALGLDHEGVLRPINPEAIEERSQDLEERWHDAGQLYWGSPQSWLGQRNILDAVVGYEIPSWRVQDIDTEDDWRRAELIHRLLASQMDTG